MRSLDIYKITYPNGTTKLYKQLKDFYADYKQQNTDDTRNYDSFRYIINNNLYNSDKTYKHRKLDLNYRLNVENVEKYDFKEFLQDYLNEYKIVRQVKDSEYTKSTSFYNKIYELAKYRVETSV